MKKNVSRITLMMLLITTLIFSSACSKASTAESKEKEAQNVTFEATFSEDNMMTFIKEVASVDDARITGFEGESNTADRIKTHFETLGFETSVQSFPIQSYALLDHALTFISDNNRSIENVNPLSYSIGTAKEGLQAEVISVGLGADADYTNKDVKGKIVLVQRGGEFFYIKTDRAVSKGAVGVIFYDPNGESISATLTKLSQIPAVSILKADADVLEQALLKGDKFEVNLMIDSICEDSESQNVIGVYKSKSNPDGKKVIVGAHYDGVNTPAANDNASGTAVIMEVARALAEQKIEFPYDIQFMAFGAEEIGLVGSDYYASQMSADERKNTICMVNFDMVGVGDGVDIATAGDPRANKLVDAAKAVFKTMDYEATTSETDRSDHASFASVGIKAIYIQATPDHNYHTDEDTIDKIKPDMLVTMCDFCTKLLIESIPEFMK